MSLSWYEAAVTGRICIPGVKIAKGALHDVGPIKISFGPFNSGFWHLTHLENTILERHFGRHMKTGPFAKSPQFWVSKIETQDVQKQGPLVHAKIPSQ